MFKSKRLLSALCGILFTVAVTAAPVDITSHRYMVPQIITSNALALTNDSTMTHSDYVAPIAYVVINTVPEHVPIALIMTDELIDLAISEVVEVTNAHFSNHAVMQNLNFERQLSF